MLSTHSQFFSYDLLQNMNTASMHCSHQLALLYHNSNTHPLPDPACNSLQARTVFCSSSFILLFRLLTFSLYTLSLELSMSVNLMPKPIIFSSCIILALHYSPVFIAIQKYSNEFLIPFSVPVNSIQLSKAFLSHLLENNASLKLHFYS